MNGFDLDYTVTSSGNSYTGLFASTESLAGFLQQIASLGVDHEEKEEGSSTVDKAGAAVGLAFDAHNLSMDGVALLAKKSSVITTGFKTASKYTGLLGVVIGGGMAAKNIFNGEASWNDYVSLTLALGSAALLIVQPEFAAAEAVTVGVDVLAITNDVISASKLHK